MNCFFFSYYVFKYFILIITLLTLRYHIIIIAYLNFNTFIKIRLLEDGYKRIFDFLKSEYVSCYFKMKLLLALVATVAFANARYIEQEIPEYNTAYGYMQNYGIPLAQAIYKAEQENNEPRIIGGSAARLGQFPYQVCPRYLIFILCLKRNNGLIRIFYFIKKHNMIVKI